MRTAWIEDQILSAGAAAVGAGVVTTLLQLNSLDCKLTIALFCFSYSIPMNTFLFVTHASGLKVKAGFPAYLVIAAYMSALFIFWVGMVYTVSHLSERAGIMFALALFLCLALLLCFNATDQAEKSSKDSTQLIVIYA